MSLEGDESKRGQKKEVVKVENGKYNGKGENIVK